MTGSTYSLTLGASLLKDDDEFTVVKYNRRNKNKSSTSGLKPVPAQADAVNILSSPSPSSKQNLNFIHLLADDDGEDYETQEPAPTEHHNNKKFNMNPPPRRPSLKSFKKNHDVDILDDPSAMKLLLASDKAVESKHVVETRKEISPKTVKSLEPIFRHFKMVCESAIPFPGFRLGPGGSVIRRAPFLSKRLAARMKQAKKEEKVVIVDFTSPDFSSTSHQDECSWTTLKPRATANATSSYISKKFYRCLLASFLLSCLTSVCALSHGTNHKVETAASNNLGSHHGHHLSSNGQGIHRRSLKKLQNNELDNPREPRMADEEDDVLFGKRKLIRHLNEKFSNHGDSDETVYQLQATSARASKGKGKGNQSSQPSTQPIKTRSKRPEKSVKPTPRKTTQPSTARIIYNQCSNANRLIPDFVYGDTSSYIYDLPLYDKVTVTQNFAISAVEVFVNISHTFRGDLLIQLVHDKTTVLLQNNADDSDYHPDVLGTYPTTLTPEEPLSAFHGTISGGTWTLQIKDDYSGDQGTLHQWCIQLRGEPLQITDEIIQYATYQWVTNNADALALFGDISTWDTSKVTNLDNVFGRFNLYAGDDFAWAASFNDDVSLWDTSQVTSMFNTFYNAEAFNGDLSKWNTSQVTDMTGMFAYAYSFNADLSKWDIGQVQSLANMFAYAVSFDGDLSQWDTRNVISLGRPFIYAKSFRGGDLSEWNTSQVTTMKGMFFYAESFNGNISTWDVSKVTRLDSMFALTPFNGDISNWDTSKTQRMGVMFANATAFNGDVSKWNTSQVTDMHSMFQYATSFNGDVSKWDTSQVTDMGYLFNKASSFNRDVSKWNTSQVTAMTSLFSATKFNGDVSKWNTNSVIMMQYMFWNLSSFNCDLSSWDTSRVQNMKRMFYNASKFNSNLSNWNTSQVTLMSGMFFNALSFNQVLCWNTSKLTNDTDSYYGTPGLMIFDGSHGSFAAKPYPQCLLKPTMKPKKKTKKA